MKRPCGFTRSLASLSCSRIGRTLRGMPACGATESSCIFNGTMRASGITQVIDRRIASSLTTSTGCQLTSTGSRTSIEPRSVTRHGVRASSTFAIPTRTASNSTEISEHLVVGGCPTMRRSCRSERASAGVGSTGVPAHGRSAAAEPRPADAIVGRRGVLMNLAYSNLNRSTPDPAAAEQYARAALQRKHPRR